MDLKSFTKVKRLQNRADLNLKLLPSFVTGLAAKAADCKNIVNL